METTLLLAKILGVYFIVSGIFVITHRKTLMLIMKDMFSHRSITYIVGVLLVFGGSALLLRGSTGGGLSLFVTLMSWAILIKGIMYIFAPESLQRLVKSMPNVAYSTLGLVVTLLGAYLVFFLG